MFSSVPRVRPRLRTLAILAGVLLIPGPLPARTQSTPAPILTASDVVFMYQGARATYEAYGATVLAWGGKPSPAARAEAAGVRWFGSVGMVTEFDAYHRRYPDQYEDGLCRDLDGKPVRVPWLADHQSKGVPYWWCCTRQPVFREFLRQRVVETLEAGADGLHVDDHLGTAGGLWLGLCFCDRCVEGFRSHLSGLPADSRSRLGVADPADFNYREAARRWIADQPAGAKVTSHPLWSTWTVYQCRAAAAFMLELRQLAAQTARRAVPVGANAGLLWPRHLADFQALDLFTAETDHHASDRRLPDLPLFAYRLAEAMGRPYAATASGGDWAYVKEHNLPGLVRGWIALSYAGGQRLMAPHRQWCHTPEKGTHWYDGPTERFAPLYRFVRQQAAWLDGFQTHADLAVLLPHRAFLEDPKRWFDLANRLAAGNRSYRLIVAGDEIVDRPLTGADFAPPLPLLVPDRQALLPRDRDFLENQLRTRAVTVYTNLEPALAAIQPAVRLAPDHPDLRVLPRVQPGRAAVHFLNYAYDPGRDDVVPRSRVRVRLDLAALGVNHASHALWISPGSTNVHVPLVDGAGEIPELGLWGWLAISRP